MSVNVTASTTTYEYSNSAYLWSSGNWSLIQTKNPCGNDGQNLAFEQPCTSRVRSNVTELVVVTFNKTNSCTSIFNLISYNWSIVNAMNVDIPFGGHLITSIDQTRVFYLGGIYFIDHEETQSLDVFELGVNGWQLIVAKLPFGIASNETKIYQSLHNVTLN